MRLALTSIVLAAALALAGAACPNHCSQRGECNTDTTCTCHHGFTAADCSQRLCPMGNAWADVASADDTAHALAECANRGSCDRKTGKCACYAGFGGVACEQMLCPSDCNGHGVCKSMAEAAAQRNDVSLLRLTTYDGVWDAGMIRGCVCDEGYTGYDCSQQTCPSGDDPMTTGQVDEVQTLHCLCPDTCTGSFVLSFRNRYTVAISPTATAEDVQAALEAVPTVWGVNVTILAGDAVCGGSEEAVSQITFTNVPGDVPELRVVSALRSDNMTALAIYVQESVAGTRENIPCNGRGSCSATTGRCQCLSGFTSSDGAGSAGLLDDCGHVAAPPTGCPYSCSGHGACSGAPEFRCSCYDGWAGFRCNSRECPFGRAWFDEATAPDTAHAPARCSNRGLCDRESGRCSCQRGFEGGACQRMSCPAGADGTCHGHGECRSMRLLARGRTVNGDAAPVTYGATPHSPHTWDADAIQGCACDRLYYTFEGGTGDVPDYLGYACNLRGCPTGDDPSTPGGAFETQRLICDATAGAFTLRFRQHDTAPVPFNATADALRAALEALDSIGTVSVRIDGGETVCTDGGAAETAITFLTELGRLPLLTIDASALSGTVAVDVLAPGSKETVTCSNRGVCDYAAGLCRCFPGSVSSDGDGNRGFRGDCGAKDVLGK